MLLLAHDPRRLVEAADLNVPAVLSGHTHGGQVVLPGVGAIARRSFPVLSGLGQQGDTSIFVSRGVGTVYVPVRINCPPEVALVTLQRTVARLTKRRPSIRQPPRAPSHGLRIRVVLLDENPRGQRVGRIVSRTGTARCTTIGPPSSSAVTRCTVTPLDLHAVLECLPLRVDDRETTAAATGGCSESRLGNASISGAPEHTHEPGEAHTAATSLAEARCTSARS